LSADLGDAAEFAYLCGARQMEVLSLSWDDVDRATQIVHFRRTKTGKPRSNHYGQWPELATVIERRVEVKERLKRAAVITPWVFCFAAPVAVGDRQHHAAGAPLFKDTADRGLLTALCREWARACVAAGLPGRLFHDLRRSAARNLERAGVSRSVAMKWGGWSDRIYSRYAIATEGELAAAGASMSGCLSRAGWHSGGSGRKKPRGCKGIRAKERTSRTIPVLRTRWRSRSGRARQ
jgi:integrase